MVTVLAPTIWVAEDIAVAAIGPLLLEVVDFEHVHALTSCVNRVYNGLT